MQGVKKSHVRNYPGGNHRPFARWFRWGACCSYGLLIAVLGGLPDPGMAQEHLPAVPNEIILRLNIPPVDTVSGTIAPRLTTLLPLDSLSKAARLVALKPFLLARKSNSFQRRKAKVQSDRYYRLIFDDSTDIYRVIGQLLKNPDVTCAEPNYYAYRTTPKADFVICERDSAFKKIQLPTLNTVRTSSEMLIGLIDTGFETVPPEIKKYFWKNPLEIPQNGLDDDHNGYIDDVYGGNFLPSDSTGDALSGRSVYLEALPTHVTGLLQILTNNSNSDRSAGAFAPGCIIPCLAGSRIRSGSAFPISACAEAIIYAVDQGARILLLTWACPYYSSLLHDAIAYAAEKGCFIIAAAGNQNSNRKNYPAAFPSVLSVAAVNTLDQKTAPSNFGKWIDLAAPGNIHLPSHQSVRGTSVAAAVVARVAHLILTTEGKLNPDSLKKKLIFSCDHIDSLNPQFAGLLGTGRINANRALNDLHQPWIVLQNLRIDDYLGNQDGSFEPGETARIQVTIQNLAANAQNIGVELVMPEPNSLFQSQRWEIPALAYQQTCTNDLYPFELTLSPQVAANNFQNYHFRIWVENGLHKTLPCNLSAPSHSQPLKVNYWPARDTSLVKGDSLPIRFSFQGQVPARFQSQWWLNDSLIEIVRDSIFNYTGRGRSDTVLVQVMAADTVFEKQWRIRPLKPRSSSLLLRRIPASDTTVMANDSLMFLVDVQWLPPFTPRYQWRVNGVGDSAATTPKFVYRTPRRAGVEKIQAVIQIADTTFTISWAIKVQTENVPPEWRVVSPDTNMLTVSEGDSLLFKIRAFDPDGDSLKYHWAGRRAQPQSSTDSMVTFYWDYTAAGWDTIRVQISDPDTVLEKRWYLWVQNRNRCPRITAFSPVLNATILRGDTLRLKIQVHDPDRQALQIQWKVGEILDSLAENQSQLQIRADSGTVAPITVSVHVSDGDTTIGLAWSLQVRNQNAPPVLSDYWPAADTVLNYGDSLLFKIRSQDPDADTLNYQWRLNGRLMVTPADTCFPYCVNGTHAAVDTIRLQVSDGIDSCQHRWLVQLHVVNHPPEAPRLLRPIQGEVLAEEEGLHWTEARDPDAADSTFIYVLQIASDSSFKKMVAIDRVKNACILLLANCTARRQLQEDTRYYWRVRAIDVHQDSSDFCRDFGVFYIRKVNVKISNIYAEVNVDGGITIFWETAYEYLSLGYNLWRKGSQKDKFVLINPMLIRGASPYCYLDRDVEPGQVYQYRLESVSDTGQRTWLNTISATAPVPETFALHQNYPNPVTFETIIRYQLPRRCAVRLYVYNILGKAVRTLVTTEQEKGFYNIVWDGRDDSGAEVGSGIYFYSILTNNFHETRKTMVVR